MKHRILEIELAPEPVRVPPPPPESTRATVGPIVLAGIGVAGLAVFTGIALSADADYRDLERSCGSNCSHSDVDALQRRYLVGDAFLLTGAAALVGSGLWWLFSGTSRDPTVRASTR